MSNKFFTELSRTLAEQSIQTAGVDRGRLPILLDGQPAICVEPSGMLYLSSGYVESRDCSELYHKVVPFSEMVYEYTSLMENAPLLQSDSGNESYHLLADFNGVVLTGKEKGRYGYQFATWRHDASGTGFQQGNYFMNGYAAAKEDFACRAGLVEKGRQFTDEQLTELYRCAQDTLDHEYELSDAQISLLERTQEQIEAAVPDLRERIVATDSQTFGMQMNQ